jgi:endonuclease-3
MPILDELISTILSQNTNDANRDRAFRRLKERYTSWEQVRDASPDDVVDAIRSAGLANQKGERIQSILCAITVERGSLDVEFLRDLPSPQAWDWLIKFKGVGPKTTSIVLLFSLGKPAFPVDTHIQRVTGRVGLRPAKMSNEKAHQFLSEIFPPETYAAAHLNIIHLGREICHPRNPDCENCPLNSICDYYRKS